MSKQLFEVSEKSGQKHSINAAHVVSVVDNGDNGASIVFAFGGSLDVKDTYRSVRGYVKKVWAKLLLLLTQNNSAPAWYKEKPLKQGLFQF